ncbi:MAG: hypothetical protein WB565_18140 [Acidimicrobiales bacterium]
MDPAQEIGLTGWFRIQNQGESTAFVEMPPGVAVFPSTAGHVSLNAVKQPRPSGTIGLNLSPGEERLLLVQVVKTVEEWTQLAAVTETKRGYLYFEILATDAFLDGIRDVTRLRFKGLPIHFSQTDDAWVGGPDEATTVGADKTIRTYPNLKPLRRQRKAALLERLRSSGPLIHVRQSPHQPSG